MGKWTNENSEREKRDTYSKYSKGTIMLLKLRYVQSKDALSDVFGWLIAPEGFRGSGKKV